MPISLDDIQSQLKNAFPHAVISINDATGDGNHYAVCIQSACFLNKTLVQQHQMVYKALSGAMHSDLHALSIKTIPLSPQK